MIKKIIILNVLVLAFVNSYACPVCERNKAKILQGITHGSNPNSNWDYVIVIAMICITIFTLFYSIKWLIKPREEDKTHIKYSLLNKQ
jgi:phage shock protein PspC (stress-responsive transcriptional regulator)